MKKILTVIQYGQSKERGFAMLFTVLVISIILAIAIGVASASYKQGILSGLVADSQTSLYQADSASECALAAQENIGTVDQNGVAYTPHCLSMGSNGAVFVKTFSQTNPVDPAATNYYVFEQAGSSTGVNTPCFIMSFDNTYTQSTQKIITGYGYNICAPENPRRLERAIQLYY